MQGLKRKLEIFSASFSTEESTLLVADMRATFADWVDWTRAAAGVADEWVRGVSVEKKIKRRVCALGGSNPGLRGAVRWC